MNDAESSERAQLRLERARLDQQRAQLETDVARLAHSKDLPSVRALGVRLARHHGELATFVAALEAFHAQYGPLGE
jgi:transposase